MSEHLSLPLPVAEQRIAWTLAHSGFSDWLKNALRSALNRDPVDVANDLELLSQLLHPWANARIDQLLGIPDKPPADSVKEAGSIDHAGSSHNGEWQMSQTT
jgi:hypothetical protein